MDTNVKPAARAVPWNKGKLLSQKPTLKLKEIWAIRIGDVTRQFLTSTGDAGWSFSIIKVCMHVHATQLQIP